MCEVEGVHSLTTQMLNLLQGTLAEFGIVLLLRSVPSYLGNGECARIEHVLSMFGSGYIFRPEVGLYAGDAAAFGFG